MRKRGAAGGWRPILTGEAAGRARRTAEEIGGAIQRHFSPSPAGSRSVRKKRFRDASLAGGSAGLAVFYRYLNRSGLGRADSRDRSRSVAIHFLQEAADAVAAVTMDSSLYSGFTGVAWAAAHLEKRPESRGDWEGTEAIDEALEQFVSRRGWQRDYDLVSGLVGLGVYALERLPAPVAVRCLEGVIDRLEETAEDRTAGITWHTAARLLPPHQRDEYPHGFDNLGLAHGVPGVIALLGAAWAAGVKRRKARRLLDGAVAWLLRQRLADSPGALFPAWRAPGVERKGCRSAWCYGDPGVAAALLSAARSVGEPAWEREALEIARGAANRPPDQAGVVDAGLCHGAAGLGHLFNRMYQATGDPTLARAARFWLERTLPMRRTGRGIAGFSTRMARPNGKKYWKDEPGILTGAAGIALALLAATTSIVPEWDRMLLLSTREGFETRPSKRAALSRNEA